MGMKHRNLKGIVTATVIFTAICAPATAQMADSTDEKALLARLAEASAAEAPQLDRQLQAIWNRSGSPAMDFLLTRGRDALERGDTAAAIEHLTALTDHAPEFAEGWFLRATAYYTAGLYGPALSDLERALTINPNNYDAIFGLGTLLEAFGNPKLAFEAYGRALALNPHHEETIKAMDRLKPEVEGKAL